MLADRAPSPCRAFREPATFRSPPARSESRSRRSWPPSASACRWRHRRSTRAAARRCRRLPPSPARLRRTCSFHRDDHCSSSSIASFFVSCRAVFCGPALVGVGDVNLDLLQPFEALRNAVGRVRHLAAIGRNRHALHAIGRRHHGLRAGSFAGLLVVVFLFLLSFFALLGFLRAHRRSAASARPPR